MNEQNLERIIALLNTYPVPANVDVTADDGHLYFALTHVTPLLSVDPPVHGATLPPGTPVDMAKPHLTSDARAMLVRQGTLLAVTPADLEAARAIQKERHLAALREAENQARMAQGLPPLADEPEGAQAETAAPEPIPEETPEPETVRLSRRSRKPDIETPEEN